MTAKNPFRKYRIKYFNKWLTVMGVALALFSYILAVYVYKLPLVFSRWGLALILSTILAGFVELYLVFVSMFYALQAVYFWRLERLYNKNPRLAVRYFAKDYYSEDAKLVRKALRAFGLS